MVKIITCASFYGSGSSALTDLIAEYSDVKDLTDYEFRFLHDIDGISDLEFHLCDCHNRHNSGHALKRFIRLIQFYSGNRFIKRYEPYFNGQFKKISHNYINKLVDFSFKGWWFYDLYDFGELYYYVAQTLNKLVKRSSFGRVDLFSKVETYCTHPTREVFLEETQAYLSELFQVANPEGLPYLEIDQLLPSQNIERIMRYISEPIDVFVIDRDPRDIYISEKYYWKGKICPVADANVFCDWFLYTRQSGSKVNNIADNITYLKFEDLIYRYDEMLEIIENKTGLLPTKHNQQFSKFNPRKSIINTQLWKKHPEENEAIKIIEDRLRNYLYPFEDISGVNLKGIEPNELKIF